MRHSVWSPRRRATLLFFLVLGWVWSGASPVLAHDPNLTRWDVASAGDSVLITLRTSGSGLARELRADEPDAAWDEMSREEYRHRVASYLENAVEFREGKRRLPVKVERLRLGHETSATLRVARRRKKTLRAFTLDLGDVSSRPHQHHLVFVQRDTGRDRFMLRASDGLVLRWTRAPTSPSAD